MLIETWTAGEMLGLAGILSTAFIAVWSQKKNNEAREDERRIAHELREAEERRRWLDQLAPPIQDVRNVMSRLGPVGLRRWVNAEPEAIEAHLSENHESWQRIRDELGKIAFSHPSQDVRDAVNAVRSRVSGYLATWGLDLSSGSVQDEALESLDDQQAGVARAIEKLSNLLHGENTHEMRLIEPHSRRFPLGPLRRFLE